MSEINIEKFGSKLREMRKQKKYTQQELADIVGVKKSAISNYENGYSTPRYDVMIRLSKVLDIKLIDFYDETFWLKIEAGSDEIMTYKSLEDLANKNKDNAFYSFIVKNKKLTQGENAAWLEIEKKFEEKSKTVNVLVKYQSFAENGDICIIERNKEYSFAEYIENKEEKYFKICDENVIIKSFNDENNKIIGIIEGYYVHI